jgi:lipopolysaccharide/colanic/teichoic acid biosynthesis glycosyltransferase
MKVGTDISPHKEQIREEIKHNLVLSKVKSDSRIFPFGKFLRKSCLDELPQLINILRGEMSLVGPRPELPYAIYEYKLWHCARLDALPGMTGLWQIKGKNSTTFTQMIRYDIEYCQQLSFWTDLKILLLTIPAIIKQVF